MTTEGTSETATGTGFPRRTLLKSATALGAGLALARAEFLPSMAADAATAENIQDILDITVTTEMFGVTILGAGLESNRMRAFNAPFTDAEVAVVTAARAQEQFHLNFFQSLGGKPLTGTFHLPTPTILTDRTMFFNTVQQQEGREVAAQIAAMLTFVSLSRADLVKASFQYAAEEAEHRLVANYAAGARPANNIAFAPMLYSTVAAYLANLQQLGIIGGSGPALTFPGPGMIDPSNVIERTPGGVSVSGTASAPSATAAPSRAASAPGTAVVPNAAPRTGAGGGSGGVFVPRRLGDG